MALIRNAAKERLKNGEVALGVGIRLVSSVEIAKIMKTAGFDWLFIDLEHGTMSIETASQISVAALDAGIAPIIRVPEGELTMATRLLGGGALGIVMPHVDTAEQARALVDALKYAPEGHLSVGPVPAQLDFRPIKTAEMAAELNAATLLVAMLETETAIENAEAIAAVPGLDSMLIGTNDLCMDMGIPGEFTNSRVVQAYERVIAACRKHGKFPGMGGMYSDELLTRYIGMGCRLIIVGADLSFLLGAARGRAQFARGVLGK